MVKNDWMKTLLDEFGGGIRLAKCRRCGCMRGALEAVATGLTGKKEKDALMLRKKAIHWLEKAEPERYTWLGCRHCYPAVALNAFEEIFPGAADAAAKETETADSMGWPPVVGEYFVLPGNRGCHVAVSTLASVDLASELAGLVPPGLCIVGKTETENIGIEKLIHNTITNPALHVLVLCGRDSEGHRSGATLLALCKNGIDGKGRVIGSPGRRPILKNVKPAEVEAFRRQVACVDLIGQENVKEIVRDIGNLAARKNAPCGDDRFSRQVKPVEIGHVDTVRAQKPLRPRLDRAGYFVILPLPKRGIISVEHYSNDNHLLRIVEGKTAAEIYGTIVKNGWVKELSHAAYLGKELSRAELSLTMPVKYVQDGA